MAIDQHIDELVRLYSAAIKTASGPGAGSEAAAIALGMENAALAAASAEAAMVQSIVAERMAVARMKAAGMKW